MRRRVLLGFWQVSVGVLLAAGAQAQTKPASAPAAVPAPLTAATFAGRYEGSAVTPNGVETFVAEFKLEKGVITGTITTATTVVNVTGGSVAGDKFSLTIEIGGEPGTIAGAVKDGKYEGQWASGAESGAFTMKKVADASAAPAVAPAAPAPAAPKPAVPASPSVAGADPLTGDWDAVIDAGGNQMPFVLSLKLDGQKVTGQLSSDMGTIPFEGTWVNGTLNFAFSGPNGMPIAMAATVVEGKLAGTFSIADGQMTGGWAAAKRK